MPEFSNQTIILKNAPSGEVNPELGLTTSTFELQDSQFSTDNLKPTEIAIKSLYFSNDPSQRSWIQKNQDLKRLYIDHPIKETQPMLSNSLSEIIALGSDLVQDGKFKVGQVYTGLTSWSKYSIVEPKDLFFPVDTNGPFPLYYHLSLFGITTMAAWAGVSQVFQVGPEDTVVVSAASGATGNMAVQLAKKVYGAKKVIGITSSEDQAKFVESIGADVGLNYHDEDFENQLDEAVGAKGTTFYFDCVGGWMLDLVLDTMATNGRVLACGSIAGYNDRSKSVVHNWSIITPRRLNVKGFIVLDYFGKAKEFAGVIGKAYQEGKISFKEGENVSVANCSGDKFANVPKTWKKLFDDDKPSGKLITFVSDL
ncbi:unnamed protein product [Ambrosiozyma monospora]|uniref:Unnamed protein product n=1 Tax=Ambrosiozyma monospora TaxID=43982 RepID=A0A9W6YWS9_AMBMO|nr:unnamed protein product [Ambrosiozyma monospora]